MSQLPDTEAASRRSRRTPSAPWRMDSAEPYYAYRLLHAPRAARRTALWLVGIFAALVGFLFTPWQQNIQSTGEVTALSPTSRPQKVPSVLAGQIVAWFVSEGQYVNAGDSIARIVEVKDKYFDPELLIRLREQIVAKERAIEANRDKRKALIQQYEALTDGRVFKLNQARNKLAQSRFKLTSDSMAYIAAEIDYRVAQVRLSRQDSLYRMGLKSRTDLESRQLKFQETQAKLVEARNKVDVARQEVMNARIELNTIQADVAEKLAKSLSERNSVEAYIQESESDLSKMRNDFANMSIRRNNHIIRAPQDGYIVQAQVLGIGDQVKAGQPVVTVMPDKPDLAVELFVKDTDIPLLNLGRKVRLQFDGWPALQVSGWPSVSVGTFGGEVAVIDYYNEAGGDRYRVLITPDPDDEPWPQQLRLGSGVLGWAMLDVVPLWFELWRQLNGFPPSLQNSPSAIGTSKAK